ncbi:serine/threonine-protein phosphatase 2A regulatory subunit B'' subunit beta isoform X1 [Pongo abelii]|uniref:serine/threonine-protein phosphatase 2A regulatory subunit B'' subunit beta isoform X1 n=1 Tax=Pongo abelii TaxID=9601 RepID=UPI003005764E
MPGCQDAGAAVRVFVEAQLHLACPVLWRGEPEPAPSLQPALVLSWGGPHFSRGAPSPGSPRPSPGSPLRDLLMRAPPRLSSRGPVDARSRASHVTAAAVQKAPPCPAGRPSPERTGRGEERRGPEGAEGSAGSGEGGEESSRVCTVAGREGRPPPPPAPCALLSLRNARGAGPGPRAPGGRRMERAEPGPRLQRPAGPGPALPRERGARPGPRRALRADGMRLRERSLRQDPDLRQELASLARGCDFVLPSRFKKRLKAFQQVQTRKEEPLPPATSQSIPTFYFPRGRPQDSVNVDAVISKIESTFAQFPHERATMDDMGLVAKACGCPFYWKGPLFYGAGGERTGSVSVHKFVAMWRKILQNCHDDAAKFLHLLMSPGCNYLVQEDFVPFLQDVVNTHPGLSFLKEASEFHSRYITTVIQRIFYAVNRSWSGRITCAELRRSSFLQNVALLEEEADINQLTEFFSYEHFYVIYCKFWELDTDHDLLIDADDLARHNDHAISTKMIDRIFSGAVTRGRKVQKEGRISYADFVWFLISEEDKKTPTSIEYWFRCMDLDGDGALSMFELEYFYEEQCRRLDSMAIEALPFQDCLCQMLDLVKPRTEGKITLRDLKRCKLANVFFDTFFNIEKYLDHEQKEQISPLRDGDSSGPELSDWEKYAAEEYDILVAEETAGEPWEDGFEAELSPVEQKLSALRSPLAQRTFFEAPSPLGAMDLYGYACGDEDLEPL